jgi:hypothetical protein
MFTNPKKERVLKLVETLPKDVLYSGRYPKDKATSLLRKTVVQKTQKNRKTSTALKRVERAVERRFKPKCCE